jgi:hypothetical protein
MSIVVTNIKPSQALHGQAAIVTLDTTLAPSILPNIEIGMLCEIVSNGTLGHVSKIDFYGYTFEIIPLQLNLAFESQPGYLASGEEINVGGGTFNNILLQEDDYAILLEDGSDILLEN